MTSVRIALFLLLVAGCLQAETPYQIQAYVRSHKTFDANDLWKALNVPAVLSDPHIAFGLKQEFDCRSSTCEVWLQQVQLSDDGSRAIILQVTQRLQGLNRYLVFDNKSRLIGYFDSTFAKYFDPVVYPVELGGKWWLVLREQSGSGSGFAERIQRWFELRSGKLVEALSILDDAYELGYPGLYVRRPSAKVTGFQRARNEDELRVLYILDYVLVDDDAVDIGFFGSISKELIYKRSKSEVTFKLSLSEAGDNSTNVFSPFEPGATADSNYFLKTDLNQLLEIAHGPRSLERQWLVHNLPDFPASPERGQIMKALAGHSRSHQ